MERELTIEIKNPALIIIFLVLLVFFFLELQVTFNTPIAFGDEGFYTRMSQWFGENLEYPKWIPFRVTNLTKRAFTKPPLWSMLQGSIIMIIGFHETFIKFFTPFIALLCGLASFILVKKIYNERIGFMTVIMLVTIPSFIVYAVTFYTDMLETLYLTMFFFLFILGLKEDKIKYLLAAVCFSTLAYFTKKTGFISLGFIFLAFLYEFMKRKPFWELFKKYSILFVVALAFSSTLIIRTFLIYGAPCDTVFFDIPSIRTMFPKYGCDEVNFEGKYKYAGRVAETGSEKTILDMGILNYLTFAYGNIWLVIFGVCAGMFVLLKRRNRIDKLILAVLLMYIPILMRSVGRSEDAARFALPWAPVICSIAAIYFDELYKFIRSYQKYIAVLLFVIIIYGSYQNFVGKIGVMAQVKQFYPSFFEGCNWIRENTPEDSLIATLWVHRAGYCTQRRVAALGADLTQSNDANYTLNIAKQFGINYIWINKFSIDPRNRHFSEMIDLSFVQLLEENTEHFEKVYETGPPMSECTQKVCDGNIIYEVL